MWRKDGEMRRRLGAAVVVLVVAAIGLVFARKPSSTTTSVPAASTATATTNTSGATTRGSDFSTADEQAALSKMESQGTYFKADNPYTQQDFDQGELLSVQGVSPSAKSMFSSDAFFGPLEYEAFADSGLAHTAKPNANFVKNYCLPTKGTGKCAQVGRATGVIAVLTPNSIRSQARGFKRATDRDYTRAYGGTVAIRPPGYLTGKGVTQAGHLLGYELGGPVRNPRNFVTQWNLANAPAQNSIEDAINKELSKGASSLTMLVRITPQYQGTCVVPYEVDYQAVGSDGWRISTTPTGIAAKWLKFKKGSDGVTIAQIRNAEPSGSRWLVPGQDPHATCVPSGYSG
jgi:hypothetical protein